MSVRRVGSGRTVAATRVRGGFSTIVKDFYTTSIYGRHNEAAGVMLDYSGNNRNGLYSGITLGATGLVPSESDTAATYPGAGNAIVPYASWMDAPTALTLYAVAKTTMSGIGPLLDRDDGGGSRVWQWRLSSGTFQFVKIGGTGGVVTAASASTYNDGATHHFGATYDGSNIRLYVDGAKVTTQSAAGTLGAATQPLRVGNSTGAAASFNGTLAHWFVISGTVLADADFATLYAAR